MAHDMWMDMDRFTTVGRGYRMRKILGRWVMYRPGWAILDFYGKPEGQAWVTACRLAKLMGANIRAI